MTTDKIELTAMDVHNIQKSANECWICSKFSKEIISEGIRQYLPVEEWWDDGIEEHIKQIKEV